jgi:hypothetical protein
METRKKPGWCKNSSVEAATDNKEVYQSQLRRVCSDSEQPADKLPDCQPQTRRSLSNGVRQMSQYHHTADPPKFV